jgi:hypothetical protein
VATLANLRTYVSSKLNLANTAAGAEQLLIDGWANEALELLSEREAAGGWGRG